MQTPTPRASRVRWPELIVGCLVLVVIAALESHYGFRARLGGPAGPGPRSMSYVSPGEALLWLTTLTLLCPACVLLGYALSPSIEQRLRSGLQALQALYQRRPWHVLGAITLLFLLGYRLGRWVLLRDYAVTGDETMIRFGGQILAMGQLTAEKAWPSDTFTEAFVLIRDGRISSMDWLGGLLFSAASEVTRTGPWLYAALAAVTPACVFLTARHLAGVRAAWLSLCFWVVSPMAWTLSITEHTHMLSRCLVALAWLAFAKLFHPGVAANGEALPDTQAAGKPARAWLWAAVLGSAVGYSFLSRLYETVSMMAPAGVALVVAALRQRGPRWSQLWITAACFLPWVGVFFWYNWAQTGSPWVTPRDLVWGAEGTWTQASIWQRAGQNLGWNVLMLALWFLGALGLPLVWFGLRYPAGARFVAWMLGAGVGCQLLIALGHEDIGIHSVGPIHYSETAGPLTVLATLGTLAASNWLKQRELTLQPLYSLGVGYLAGMLALGGLYAKSLYSLGAVADIPAQAARAAGIHNAILLAPSPGRMGRLIPGASGSWQLAHPPPRPLADDDVLYADENVDPKVLQRAFPDRKLYSLEVNPRKARGKVVPYTPPEVREAEKAAKEAAKGKAKKNKKNSQDGKAKKKASKRDATGK